MTYQEAKNIMMGAVDATDDQIAQAGEIVRSVQQVKAARTIAKDPPFQPPYQQPPPYPNSMSQANDVVAGVVLTAPYVMKLNYDIYVYDINEENRDDYAGGSHGTGYAQLYAKWRIEFVGPGIAVDPPSPYPHRVPLTLSEFATWWQDNSGSGANLPEIPFRWERPVKISDFDFTAAVAAKSALMTNQVSRQQSLGSLEKQPQVGANP